MTEQELKARGIAQIQQHIQRGGPLEPRLIHCGSETNWNPVVLRTISDHKINVLGRAADMVIFFDPNGKVIGWRDDGIKGTNMPAWVDRDAFLKAVVDELGLPTETRLGSLEPVELPPLGWTHQAVLFLAPVPSEDQILSVWASPESLRIIQCLYAPVSP